jgi:hypothetical protein
MRSERRVHALPLISSLLVLAGCGTGEQAAPAIEQAAGTVSEQVVPARLRDACAVVSLDEIREATGIEATSGMASTSGAAKVCTWTGADGTTAVVQLFQAPGSFEGARAAFEGLYETQVESVDLGDGAFFIEGVTGQIPTATVAVQKGTETVTVQVMGMGQEAPLLREAAEGLTRTVLVNF